MDGGGIEGGGGKQEKGREEQLGLVCKMKRNLNKGKGDFIKIKDKGELRHCGNRTLVHQMHHICLYGRVIFWGIKEEISNN